MILPSPPTINVCPPLDLNLMAYRRHAGGVIDFKHIYYRVVYSSIYDALDNSTKGHKINNII